jgi:hypothetical protein
MGDRCSHRIQIFEIMKRSEINILIREDSRMFIPRKVVVLHQTTQTTADMTHGTFKTELHARSFVSLTAVDRPFLSKKPPGVPFTLTKEGIVIIEDTTLDRAIPPSLVQIIGICFTFFNIPVQMIVAAKEKIAQIEQIYPHI